MMQNSKGSKNFIFQVITCHQSQCVHFADPYVVAMCFGGLLCVPFCIVMAFFVSNWRRLYRRVQLRFGDRKLVTATGEEGDVVDHELWEAVLQRCVVPCDPEVTRSDVPGSETTTNLFDYHLCLRDQDVSKALDDYLQELAKVDLKSLSPNEELCVFLNGYHAHLVNAILQHMKQGEMDINTLDDLNNGRYRRCSKSATENSIGYVGGKPISLASMEDKLHEWQDPRIDLALCKCGSMSDPNLCYAFVPQALNDQLDASTRAFLLNNSKGVQLSSDGTVLVSQVLRDNYHLPRTQLAPFIGRYRPDVQPEAPVHCKLPYNRSLNKLPSNGNHGVA